MKNLVLAVFLSIIWIGAACETKNRTATGTKNETTTESRLTNPASAASALVKDVYDDAMRRNCAAIPAKLTEDFRKAVGTSRDELDALCDTFTDGGKLADFEIKGEDLKGDAGTVKVALTYKDGKKEEKNENVRKSAAGKWLMDS